MRPVHAHHVRLAVGASLALAFAGFPVLAVAGAAADTAPPVERRANSTRIAASLKYADGSRSEVPVWNDITVSVAKDDVQLTKDQPLPPTARASYFSPPKLLVVDLDDDADPEVLVDVFTAGYDCCRRTVVLHRNVDRYDAQVLDWTASGYRLRDVDGGPSPEFVSADDRFPALFRSDARGPLRIARLQGGQVQDVTAGARKLLERDARLHRRAWRRASGSRRRDARPAVAAYVVDLVRLGEVRAARKAIAAAARAGDLGTTANAFARRLDGRLVAWGYAGGDGPLGRIR